MSITRILIAFILFCLLAPLTLPAHATPIYQAGVAPGDVASYKPVKAVYETNNATLFPEPQSVKDFNATTSLAVAVTGVTTDKRNVTGIESWAFNNVTGYRTRGFFVDLLSGDGNESGFLIAGGLTAGDRTYDNATAPTINATRPMTYLGATRQVNIFNFTLSFVAAPYYSIGKAQVFWDQQSGIPLEFLVYENISEPDLTRPTGPPITVYSNVDLVITATNIFAPPADFLMTASRLTTSFAIGTAGSSDITVQSENGFFGTVLLTTGVNSTSLTATCGALSAIDPIYYTTSVATCTFDSSNLGVYNVTVTGTAGTLTHSVSIIVTVSPAPDFSLATDKASLTLLGGASGTIAVTVSAENGFIGTVNLSDSVSPSTGLTCTFSSSTVTLTGSTTTGTSNLSCSGVYWSYTVSITGQSDTLSNSAPSVSVIVQDFTTSQSTTSITTNSGTTGTATITVNPHDGFSGTVSLSATVDTSGLTCSLSPTTLTTGSSTLSCSGSPGTYTVTVTSTSQGLTHTTKYTVTVNSIQQTPSAPAATVLGLTPVIFYSIVAAIVVAVAAVSALALRSRKKPTA